LHFAGRIGCAAKVAIFRGGDGGEKLNLVCVCETFLETMPLYLRPVILNNGLKAGKHHTGLSGIDGKV